MEITFGSKDDVKTSKPTLKKLEVGNSEILKKKMKKKNQIQELLWIMLN